MTSDPNPGPGEFRCGDCITIRHHMELVTLAVDSILDALTTYASGCSATDARTIMKLVVRQTTCRPGQLPAGDAAA
jgi:hypothetical protein